MTLVPKKFWCASITQVLTSFFSSSSSSLKMGGVEKMCDAGCQTSVKKKCCARCRSVWYCSRQCQVKHWPIHTKFCDIQEEESKVNQKRTTLCRKLNHRMIKAFENLDLESKTTFAACIDTLAMVGLYIRIKCVSHHLLLSKKISNFFSIAISTLDKRLLANCPESFLVLKSQEENIIFHVEIKKRTDFDEEDTNNFHPSIQHSMCVFSAQLKTVKIATVITLNKNPPEDVSLEKPSVTS